MNKLLNSLFRDTVLHYKTIFGHYRKWCEQDIWKSCWIQLLKENKPNLDLSIDDLDGSHTTALRDGKKVGYQGRKKGKATNALYITDRQWLPMAMSELISRNHNALFDIEVQFEEVVSTLEETEN